MNPLAVVQDFYAALGRGDVAAVLGLLDPQVEWTEAECFPYYNGTWHGPQAVLDNLLKPLAQDWNDFSATPENFLVDGNRVVTFGIYAGKYKQTGKSMTAPFAHLWTVRGGKLASFLMYTDTAKILEALQH
jgi:ketosteroid isomerase-like protein